MTSMDLTPHVEEPIAVAPNDPLTPGPVRDKPILLAEGILLAGNSIETEEKWDIFVDRSDRRSVVDAQRSD